ncbi:MAG: hypothetical protein K8R02_00060 [Anaerohalosphaeraceae bacterium]|nr:hypothetical protein [Anaerohalosphaeraceae bacterium]
MNLDWSNFSMYYVVVNIIIMVVFTAVSAIGGGFDLAYLLKELHKKQVDELDDGRVIEDSSE